MVFFLAFSTFPNEFCLIIELFLKFSISFFSIAKILLSDNVILTFVTLCYSFRLVKIF